MKKWLLGFLGMGFVLGVSGVSVGQETQQVPTLDQTLSGTSLPATAGESSDAATEDRLSKMERMLQKQNEELEILRKQLTIQDDNKLNKARSDEIREMVKEILADEEFRNQIYQPTLQAGYDKGFYIKSADDKFYMKIFGRSQFRYTGIERQNRNRNVVGNVRQHDTSGFDLTRLRLFFNGWMWTKDLKYSLILKDRRITTRRTSSSSIITWITSTLRTITFNWVNFCFRSGNRQFTPQHITRCSSTIRCRRRPLPRAIRLV